MFIKGMDISSHPEMMDRGHRYYDYDGNEVNIIDFAREQGFNYGRLRIWNNPERIQEAGGYCDLEHTKRMAAEFKKRGMGFLLDFHYSDWWADPGNQTKPAAWQDLSGESLVQAVYDYTKDVLTALDEGEVYPDMVQVGNEIRCGMMWPDGRTDNWEELARLINAGIRAVRDTQGERGTKVMLHLDQGGRYYYFKEWFDNALAHGVADFDIIGLSYYPFWHGTFNDLKNTMEELVKRYHKPMVIAEVAHAYRRSRGELFGEAQEKISGFPAGGAAQKEVLELVMSITAHISEGMGLGIFYWEPFSRPNDETDDGWGSCMGVVDADGRPTLGFQAFRFEPEKADVDKIAKIYEPAEITVTMEDDPSEYLPGTVKVLRYDGRLEREEVTWAFEPSKLVENDTVIINGTLLQCGQSVEAPIRLADKKERKNYLKNADFENICEGVPEHWAVNLAADGDNFVQEIRQDISEEFPFGATNYYYFKGESNFKLRLSQKVDSLPAGRYTFSLAYRGDNTTGVKVQIYARTESGVCAEQSVFPSADAWTKHGVEFVLNEDSSVEVGIIVDSPAIYGMVKEVCLIAQSQPAVFLDRDGVLTVEKSYVCNREELEIFPYAKECIMRIHEKGFLAIVVTNQSGVARGYFTETQLQEMNRDLMQETGVDAVYYCPHHEKGIISKYAHQCQCRKPEIGLVQQACEDFHISVADMGRSYMVGDRASDIRFGQNAGLTTVLLESGYGTARLEEEVTPDHICRDLKDFIMTILP